jgi:hypothetical protein
MILLHLRESNLIFRCFSLALCSRRLCEARREIRSIVCREKNDEQLQRIAILSEAFQRGYVQGCKALRKLDKISSTDRAVMPAVEEFEKHYRNCMFEAGLDSSLWGSTFDVNMIRPIAISVIVDACQKLSPGKASGIDRLPSELLKTAATTSIGLLWISAIVSPLTAGLRLPEEDRTGVIYPLPKKKGASSVTDFRPISVSTSLYKLVANIVASQAVPKINSFVGDTQAAYRIGRSCSDNLWVLRRISEKAIEYDKVFYVLALDYKSAFDSIDRRALSEALSGILNEDEMKMANLLFENSSCVVAGGVGKSGSFLTNKGIKQGCPASPTFFTVAMECIHRSISSCFDGVKLGHIKVSSLEYADDQILLASSASELQNMVAHVELIASAFGLKLNGPKCEAMIVGRSASVLHSSEPSIQIGNLTLSWSSELKYLGNVFLADGGIKTAIKDRISIAESSFAKLSNDVFRNRFVESRTKGECMRSAIFGSLLYGLELVGMKRAEQRLLDFFFLKKARISLGIFYPRLLSYNDAEMRLGIKRPSLILRQRRISWAGHMLRSDNSLLIPSLTFKPAPARPRGRPSWRWRDSILDDLKKIGLEELIERNDDSTWSNLGCLAADRNGFRDVVNSCL